MSETKYVRSIQLVEAAIDDEIVGLDRQRGEVFGFNNVATAVWVLLAEPTTIADLCVSLNDEFEVEPAQCRAEVEELIEKLVDQDLVKVVTDELN